MVVTIVLSVCLHLKSTKSYGHHPVTYGCCYKAQRQIATSSELGFAFFAHASHMMRHSTENTSANFLISGNLLLVNLHCWI